jgi:hypothetical protein
MDVSGPELSMEVADALMEFHCSSTSPLTTPYFFLFAFTDKEYIYLHMALPLFVLLSAAGIFHPATASRIENPYVLELAAMIPGGIAGNSRDRKGAYLCVPYEE